MLEKAYRLRIALVHKLQLMSKTPLPQLLTPRAFIEFLLLHPWMTTQREQMLNYNWVMALRRRLYGGLITMEAAERLLERINKWN